MADEMMVPEQTYKDLTRAHANDDLWRQQLKVANVAASAQPSQVVLSAVSTLASALGGIGQVGTSCQSSGSGPVWISLSLPQVTALVTKLTTGLL